MKRKANQNKPKLMKKEKIIKEFDTILSTISKKEIKDKMMILFILYQNFIHLQSAVNMKEFLKYGSSKPYQPHILCEQLIDLI